MIVVEIAGSSDAILMGIVVDSVSEVLNVKGTFCGKDYCFRQGKLEQFMLPRIIEEI